MKRSHDIEYRMIGDDLQCVEVILDPEETVIAEAGAMAYMDEGIVFESRLGSGGKSKRGILSSVLGVTKRKLSGTSAFLTHYTNKNTQKCSIAFSAPSIGRIIPIDLSRHHGAMTCQRNAFLVATLGVDLDISLRLKLSSFLGGEGIVFQVLKGDGHAFLHACGALVERQLDHETLIVDSSALVAFGEGITYHVRKAGNLKSMMFGGEGLFLTTLKGTGTVYLQSLSVERLAKSFGRFLPRSKRGFTK